MNRFADTMTPTVAPDFLSSDPEADMSLKALRTQVALRAVNEGRTDSPLPGLRYYRFSAPTEYRKTQRLAPGLVVVLQGSKTATLADRTLSYDARRYLVLGREAICRGTAVQASEQVPYLAVHLDLPADLLAKAMLSISALDEPIQAETAEPAENNAHFVAPIDPAVLAAMARLLALTDDVLDRHTLAPLVVEEIIVRLLRSDAAAAVRAAAQVTRSALRIQAAIEFIQREHQRRLSVEELAGRVHMSASHFAHCFREISGVSPMRYLRDFRLDQARMMLLSSADLRTGEVAARVGFESPAHFNREFKRRFETTPAEYVRRNAPAGKPA